LREKFPTTPITWLAISPSIKRWSVWDKILKANNLIKKYAELQPNLYYVDAGANFLNKDGAPDSKYFVDDKLHYNDEGYKLWGKSIKESVKKITEGKF
jgi:lysophospholipase L1-like esterase